MLSNSQIACYSMYGINAYCWSEMQAENGLSLALSILCVRKSEQLNTSVQPPRPSEWNSFHPSSFLSY